VRGLPHLQFAIYPIKIPFDYRSNSGNEINLSGGGGGGLQAHLDFVDAFNLSHVTQEISIHLNTQTLLDRIYFDV
jgi:hypothetical protein